MAVNWLWKNKVGEVLYKDTKNKQNWKLEMFTGNMMCCFIYRYKQDGEKFYNFFTWFDDIEHAKRIFKDDKDFLKNMPIGEHKLRKVKLQVSSKRLTYANKEMLKLAKLLAENGYKVELY